MRQTHTVTAVVFDDDNTRMVATATVSLASVGAPPVTPPPAVPPTRGPTTPRPMAPPEVQQQLPSTGSGLLLPLGMMLVAATRNYGGGLRLAPVPGGGGWFMPPTPPKGPLGGLGVGLAEPPPPQAEHVAATVVGIRSTGALDGAALDAAQAMSSPTGPQAPRAGRRRGRRRR